MLGECEPASPSGAFQKARFIREIHTDGYEVVGAIPVSAGELEAVVLRIHTGERDDVLCVEVGDPSAPVAAR